MKFSLPKFNAFPTGLVYEGRSDLNIKVIKIDVEDEKYPQRLLKIRNFPTELYALGNMELLNAKYTVGIVGTRKCTEYGIKVANEFAKELSKNGICIISGMAIGIDGVAHNSAIEQQGRTIAVLGSGLNYISPLENEWLFHKILGNGGCIISEYPPDTEPDKEKFPIRNRIISGLSDAVLVVEAAHRSGSSITAKYAKAEGKTVYAIPNNIYCSASIGTNRLIKEGAILVTKPAYIIEEIKQETIVKNTAKITSKNYSRTNRSKEELDIKEIKKAAIEKGKVIVDNKTQNQINKTKMDTQKIILKEYLPIYRALSNEPMHINEIAKKINKAVHEVNSIITMMELDGHVYQPQTNYFVRKEEEI